MIARPSLSIALLAFLFVVAGVFHFVRPAPFIRIVPSWLPAAALLVAVSGIAEIAGGVGLLMPTTRVAAAWGLIGLLVAVFPANVKMLTDAIAQGGSPLYLGALWARLPLQPVLVWWVWQAAIRSRT